MKYFILILAVVLVSIAPTMATASDFGYDSPYLPKLLPEAVTTTSTGNITYNNTNITNNYITYNSTGNVTGSGLTGEMCIWYNQTQINYSSDFYWASEIDTLFTNYYTSVQVDALIINYTSVNDTQIKLDYLCAEDGKILKRIGGEWVCATDQEGAGAGGLNYTKVWDSPNEYLLFTIP